MTYLEQLFLHLSQILKCRLLKRLFIHGVVRCLPGQMTPNLQCWLRWSCVIIMKWLLSVGPASPHPLKQRWMSVGDAPVQEIVLSVLSDDTSAYTKICNILEWSLHKYLEIGRVLPPPKILFRNSSCWVKNVLIIDILLVFIFHAYEFIWRVDWDWKGWAGHKSQAPIV